MEEAQEEAMKNALKRFISHRLLDVFGSMLVMDLVSWSAARRAQRKAKFSGFPPQGSGQVLKRQNDASGGEE